MRDIYKTISHGRAAVEDHPGYDMRVSEYAQMIADYRAGIRFCGGSDATFDLVHGAFLLGFGAGTQAAKQDKSKRKRA